MKISMNIQQAIRVAIAATLAVVVLNEFNVGHGFWVLLTVVVVMQSTLGASVHRARLRLAGTVLGVFFGALFCALLPDHDGVFYIFAIVMLFAGVYSFPISYAWFMFFLTALVIAIFSYHAPNPWGFATLRLIDTLIGLAIALLVSFVVWPLPAARLHHQALFESLQACELYFSTIVGLYFSEQYDREVLELHQEQLESQLQKNQQYYDELRYEPSALFDQRYISGSILRSEEKLQGMLLSMRVTAYRSAVSSLDVATQEKFKQLAGEISRIFKALVDAVNQDSSLPKRDDLRVATQQLKSAIATWESSQDKMIYTSNEGMNILLFLTGLRQVSGELRYIHMAVKQLRALKN
tara:strand:+ start:61561 stop:62616 length:1056 start_codon:yes stop_codon:yes gene_type:complete